MIPRRCLLVIALATVACGGDAKTVEERMVRIEVGSWKGQLVPSFMLDAFEVTAGEYAACVAAGACEARRTQHWMGEDRGDAYGDCNYERRPDHPMNCVDQRDAIRFCMWRHPRNGIPSRTELEWAAAGREEARRFPWGSEPPTPDQLNACGTECIEEWERRGWEPEVGPMYDADDGWPMTSPVGVHPAGVSRDGVHDLAGNVEEWTTDRKAGLVVIMGGSYGSSLAVELGPSLPSFGRPESRNSLTGLRCARAADRKD